MKCNARDILHDPYKHLEFGIKPTLNLTKKLVVYFNRNDPFLRTCK